MASKFDNTIVIPASSPEQNWARSVSPCTPSRLFGLSPLSPSPPSLLSPSKLFDEVRLKMQNDQPSPKSPLGKVSKKATAPITTAGTPIVSEHFTQTARSGSSKAKTIRNRKSSKSQEGQNKILTGRVAKATATSKAKDTTGSKLNAGTKKTKTTSNSQDDKPTKEAETKKVVDSEGPNLEEALKRRSDWTPPKASVPAIISLDEDSPSGNCGAKTSFGYSLRDYHYSRDNSVSEAILPRKEGNPTKRRRLELVESEILQERKPLQQRQTKDAEKTRKTKAKPKKHPKTITARMTALYEPIDETEGLFVFDEELEAGEDFKKPAKPKKKTSTKQKEPDCVILSPAAATKSLNDQNFLFGTCSQLERDDSPTFFEETQKAIRLSENLTLENPALSTISTVPSTTSIVIKYTSKKSHWSEAARDFHGAVVQPEIIDMTDSPTIDTALSQLSEMNREAPKMASLVSAKPTSGIKPLTEKEIIPSCRPTADIQSTSSKPKSNKIGPDIVGKKAEPSTKKPTNQLPEMPNFNGYTDVELRKKVKSYGLKAIGRRKRLIALLDKCWQSKHGNVATSADDVETSSLAAINGTASVSTARISDTQVSEELPVRKKSDGESKAASRAGKRKVVEKPAARKDETAAKKAASPIRTSSYMVDEIEDSEEEIIPSPTRIRVQRQSSTRQTTPAIGCLPLGSKSKRPSTKNKASTFDECTLIELQSSIARAIRLQTRPKNLLTNGSCPPQLTWHEKILLYEPIILEDFATWLNTEGFALVSEDREVGVALVRTWCESQGICCTFRA
ncbi:hypothetical protein EYB26_008096 [Talaromyces marneffei]|uniref:uncharacterized protein n=1 Tax=Talaromyces marneffei TaxID=37727 RepID=UPI0012A8629A|nr:uncharacterized protein EYB26_008096 [Talaromyces marneffei]QGA20394.1 hypothetical protein EYB26_008096 [Talaromyces marneffei]